MEQKTKMVFRLLRAIQKDYTKVEENLSVLGKHVNNAYNTMSNVSSSFNTLGQKLIQTDSLEEEKEIKQLEID